MECSRRTRTAAACAMGLILFGGSPAHASGNAPPHDDVDYTAIPAASHLRSAAPRGAWLIAAGKRYSPTFHLMVDDIERSDVIAYVRVLDALPNGLDGEMTFMASRGGFRYVQVCLKSTNHGTKEVSVLAHELRHVLEVAHDPLIIDDSSLATEYLTHATVKMRGTRLIAETWQARVVAAHVTRELRSRSWALDLEFEQQFALRARADEHATR